MIKTKTKQLQPVLKQASKYLKDIAKNIENATIIVKSSAIKDNNIEIKQAKKKIPIYSRAEVLADVVSLKKIS